MEAQAKAQARSASSESLPWHLWAVGALSLIWAAQCFAYFGFTGTALPAASGWTSAFLGAAMWGGAGGSLLLLLRSKWAVQAFTTSLVGVLAATASLFVFAAEPGNLYAMPMMVGLWIIAHATLLYTSRVRALGLLR